MKSNPLFFDSTKFTGETIATHIELTTQLTHESDQVYAIIQSRFGYEDRIPLKKMAEGKYKGQVWLEHQQKINYFFVIKKKDGEELKSENFEGRASYYIIHNW
jgi:hypothetical protein